MFVLFDNGTPRTLARFLIDSHMVTEARARGWQELENGELLKMAEAAGFEVLITTDKNIRYQQNLAGRKIAVVVLGKGPRQTATGMSASHPVTRKSPLAVQEFRANVPKRDGGIQGLNRQYEAAPIAVSMNMSPHSFLAQQQANCSE